MNKNTKKDKIPFASNYINKLASKIGAKVELEPEYGYVGEITYPNGKKVLFRNTNFNLNPLGSIEICKDKGYTNYILSKNGFSVPEGKTFFSEALNNKLELKRTIDDGYKFACKIGFPVILKPNNLSQGTLVGKVCDKKEYYNLAKKIFKLTNVMIVEKFCEGGDYRIVVLDNEVISTYQRIHLNVTGNGINTIEELLQIKQEEFEKIGREEKINLSDFRIKTVLKRKGLNLSSIIPKGINISLLDNANLSTGGDSEDYTKQIHSDFKKITIEATKCMGLRLCGVDIITEDITSPVKEYRIIEMNGAPGLDNYAAKGEDQVKVVEELYTKILIAMGK